MTHYSKTRYSENVCYPENEKAIAPEATLSIKMQTMPGTKDGRGGLLLESDIFPLS